MSTLRAAGLCALLLCLFAAGAPLAGAHPMAPALLELREAEAGRAEVRWKATRLLPRGTRLEPRLPSACAASPRRLEEDGQSVSLLWSIDCGEAGLVGQRIGVEGLESARIDVLVRVVLLDRRTYSRILDASDAYLEIPERQSKARVAMDYTRLGVGHILSGVDHLLFVFGLLLLVASTRSLIRVITAFTLGHSVTLSVVALGLADVPTRTVEFLIAFSVLLLGVELAKPLVARDAGDGDSPSPIGWMRRRPWIMAAGFGLLHGMGFAGALADVGLPGEEIPLALFAFNVGIELGQLVFVFAITLLRVALRAQLEAAPHWLAVAPPYAIGVLAAYWCFERAAAMLAY